MSNIALIPLFLYPTDTLCAYIIVLRLVSTTTSHASSMFIGLISIDRFMHVRFLQNYSTVFNAFRYKISIFVFFIVVTIQASISFIIPVFYGKKHTVYLLPINISIFTIMIIMYLKTLIILKKHKKLRREISSENQNITRITKFYFYLYLSSQAFLLLAYQIVSKLNIGVADQKAIKSKGNLQFATVLVSQMTIIVGIVNAFAILSINRKIKENITSIICPLSTV